MVNEMEDEYIEHAPADVIAEVHRLGHEIIVLVAKIMESPMNNAHYTEEIFEATEELEEYFKSKGLTGDGNESQPIAMVSEDTGVMTLGQNYWLQMAQLGINGLFDKMKEDQQ